MLRRNLALTLTALILSSNGWSSDFGIYLPDDPNTPSIQDDLEKKGSDGQHEGHLSGTAVEDVLGNEAPIVEEAIPEKKLSEKEKKRHELLDVGQTLGDTGSLNTTYQKIDKIEFTRKMRSVSRGAFNLSYQPNDYDYLSNNNIINETVENGFHSGKGGTVHLRHDSYISNQRFLNTFWSGGIGIGLSTGKGVFINGDRSSATFNLWQIPAEVGLGFEIPVFSLIKLNLSGGGGAMALMQNRNDYQRGEKHKRRIQVSPGYYALGEFKISLTSFSNNVAYNVFTASNITNILLNIEYRYQSYESFKEESLAISGSSIGVGLTFEYL